MGAQNTVSVYFYEHFYPEYVSACRRDEYQVEVILLFDSELEVLVTCPAFTETDSSQRWDREDNRRNAKVIWSLMVSLQKVRGHDLPFIASHRSQREASTSGGISRRKDSWNGHTLQEIIHSHTPLLPSLQRPMPGHSTGRRSFRSLYFGFEMKVYAKCASSLDELINEIRVKKGKWTRAMIEDRDLRSRKGR